MQLDGFCRTLTGLPKIEAHRPPPSSPILQIWGSQIIVLAASVSSSVQWEGWIDWSPWNPLAQPPKYVYGYI